MPLLIAAMAALVGAYFWFNRARNAANIASDLLDAADDVRLAARRFGFKRRTNVHPVEGIDDPRLAVAALSIAFLELDDYPSAEQRSALLVRLQSVYDISQNEAEEMAILGRWFVSESGGPSQAITRISRKLYKLQGAEAITPLMEIVQAIAAKAHGDLSPAQKEALADVKRAFRIS